MLTEGPSGVGTRWRESTTGLGTYGVEVVAFERERLWVEEADTSRGNGRISVAFASEGDAATRVTVTVEIHLPRDAPHDGYRRGPDDRPSAPPRPRAPWRRWLSETG